MENICGKLANIPYSALARLLPDRYPNHFMRTLR